MTTDSKPMPRLFVGNFDFEHVLAGDRGAQESAAVRSVLGDLACAWIAIAEEGDLLWTPAPIDEAFFHDLISHGFPRVRAVTEVHRIAPPVTLCPWGWTEALWSWADTNGWAYSAPPQPAVRAVNSRRFSFELETELGTALPLSTALTGMEELQRHLRHLPGDGRPWVLKAEFGMSARERRLGRGRDLAPAALQWVHRRLAADGVVFFEPWVERVKEAGVQFEVDATGAVRFLGLSPLLTTPGGFYCGSRFGPEWDALPQWQPALEIGRQVARRASELGYFGPLGIDAVRYRDSTGEVRLRPVQDVNARYTMGRLSLGFRRLLQPGETGAWLHVRPRCETRAALDAWYARIAGGLPAGVRCLRTSPHLVGDGPPAVATLVVIAPRVDLLLAAEVVAADGARPARTS